MEVGSEFVLVELLGIEIDLIKGVAPSRSRLGLIMPRFKPVKPKTGIQIQRSPLPFF